MQLAVPAPDGVNTPAEVIDPPVADQVTAELYAPVPVTVAVHCEVCAVVMLVGLAVTETAVTVGGSGVLPPVLPPPPHPQLGRNKKPRHERAISVQSFMRASSRGGKGVQRPIL